MPNPLHEVRRQNLLRLLSERGAKTALAHKMGVTQSYVSTLLRHPGHPFARPIAEETARQVEELLGLTPGEMDQPDGKRAAANARTERGLPLTGDELLQETAVAFVSALTGAKKTSDKAILAGALRAAWMHNVRAGFLDEHYLRHLVKYLPNEP